jgi:hypothetical protein
MSKRKLAITRKTPLTQQRVELKADELKRLKGAGGPRSCGATMSCPPGFYCDGPGMLCIPL